MISGGIVTVSYIAATVLFILALGGLSHQETSRRGNWYGIAGMTIALLATVGLLAPALASADADPEIQAGPVCDPNAAADLRAQVPLDVVIDPAEAQRGADPNVVVLNNRGYGYRVASELPQPPEPTDAPN